MELTFLGTGSAYPSNKRGASAIVLHHNINGSQWLFDCGEGTQIQFQKDKKAKIGKIDRIFITHLHGDHIYGLPGLLSSIGVIDDNLCSHPIQIYGPVGLKNYIRTVFSLASEKIKFQYTVHEIDIPSLFNRKRKLYGTEVHGSEPLSGELCSAIVKVEYHNNRPAWKLFHCDITKTTVWAVPLRHTCLCVGFIVLSDDKPGKLNAKLAMQLGVKKGPMLGNLKNGEDVVLDDGTIIKSEQVIGEPTPGVNIGIMGDTCDSSHLVDFMNNRPNISNCHVKPKLHYLVHECTLQDEMHEESIKKGHSIPRMVADWANQLNVHNLVLTHFSQRYEDGDDDELNLDSNSDSKIMTISKKESASELNSVKSGDNNVENNDRMYTTLLKQQITEGNVYKGNIILARDFLNIKLLLPK